MKKKEEFAPWRWVECLDLMLYFLCWIVLKEEEDFLFVLGGFKRGKMKSRIRIRIIKDRRKTICI